MRNLLAAVVLVAVAGLEAGAEPTGSALPGLEPYDELMTALIRKWDVPGAGLALARRGKLLLVRGYGLADKERNAPVEPTSLFRLASLSKTVTAVGDVMFMPGAVDAAKRQGGSLPPDCPTIMRDTLEHTLDFPPGTRIAYSNIGYCMVGRVLETVTRKPYESYVSSRVLAQAGAGRMKVGRTLVPAESEVTYYDYEMKQVKAMPGLGLRFALRPYGEFAVETMDSYGGWIGAPVDYLRFILAIDGRHGATLLNAATRAQMNAPSPLPQVDAAEDEGSSPGSAYGLGIRVRQVKNGFNLWHSGSLPGTSTLAVRTADGFAWVAVFNRRPRDRFAFRGELDHGLWAAKGQVKSWPDGDLFTTHP